MLCYTNVIICIYPFHRNLGEVSLSHLNQVADPDFSFYMEDSTSNSVDCQEIISQFVSLRACLSITLNHSSLSIRPFEARAL
jgi:hypothetical protein